MRRNTKQITWLALLGNKNKGFVWNKCGKDSTPTCNDANPGWSGKCVPICECHPDRPYLKNNKCVTGPQCCEFETFKL